MLSIDKKWQVEFIQISKIESITAVLQKPVKNVEEIISFLVNLR